MDAEEREGGVRRGGLVDDEEGDGWVDGYGEGDGEEEEDGESEEVAGVGVDYPF